MILHLVLNDFSNDNRVLRSVLTSAKVDETHLLCLQGENTQLDVDGVKVWPVKCLSRRLRGNLLFYSIKYFEIMLRWLLYGLQSKPKVVYCNDLNTLPVGCLLKLLTGASLVYDSHELFRDGILVNGRFRKVAKLIYMTERCCIKRCDFVITVSSSIAKILERYYALPICHAVRNIPELPKIVSKLPLIQSPKEIHIALVGNLDPGRGVRTLLQEFASICHHGIYLHCFGKGSLKSEVENLIQDLNISSHVKLYGSLPHEVLLAKLNDFHLGIVPVIPTCKSYKFCRPNKFFEYLSCGLPVIVRGDLELSKIVIKNNLGASYGPDDSESLLEAIRDCILSYQSIQSSVQRYNERINFHSEQATLKQVLQDASSIGRSG